jgi:hypothetical protein
MSAWMFLFGRGEGCASRDAPWILGEAASRVSRRVRRGRLFGSSHGEAKAV